MGILNRILGNEPSSPRSGISGTQARVSDDQRALERYRYMVQTAPPEALERAHEEAFEKLTPEQRQRLLRELQRTAPPEERQLTERSGADEPSSLARLATRSEYRQPGTVERALGGAGNLLGSFGAAFLGSMAAQSFLSAFASDPPEAGTDEGSATQDFSEEFGQGADDDGLAGGDGFDGDDFDVTV